MRPQAGVIARATEGVGVGIEADCRVLERNLWAIELRNPQAAAAIARTEPAPGVNLDLAPDDGVWGEVRDGERARSLASRRRPIAEADKLAETLAAHENAVAVVLGFGLGGHCAALARRLKGTGALVVFEPDVRLMRAVLERVDHSKWIASTDLALILDETDSGAIGRGLSGLEGLVSLGVQVIEHPASAARLGGRGRDFVEQFTRVMRAVRTNVVTTLVQVGATIRNVLMNLDHYATDPGVADLENAYAGRAAVVVSAGPSLTRNLDVLSEPGLRRRVVVIAAQTVLKPMLARGIRPDYVTALDHHEISRRFYEGLTREDVEGVTLVIEPMANPAIADSFPGVVRVSSDDMLDRLLGAGLHREMGRLPLGATVAHMAYSLARHMGCDPVILIGQDLGFTDGQYYASGASIHGVWSGELSPVRTLEMLEWERIVRGRATLHRATDVLGREVYTDEQMSTYLVQFETMFKGDAERGLRTIDATEGGVSKRYTEARALREALEMLDASAPVRVAPTPARLGNERLRSVQRRVHTVRRDTARIARLSERTIEKLEQIRESQSDRRRVDRLVDEIGAMRDEVVRLEPAWELVRYYNQTGTLNRYRDDRLIKLDDLTPEQRQLRQVERDIRNVTWVRDAARDLCTLLDAAGAALSGGTKLTRDLQESLDQDVRVTREPVRARGVVTVDLDRASLGHRRRVDAPIAPGMNVLQLTVRRLLAARRLDGVVLMTHEAARVRTVLGELASDPRVEVFETDGPPMQGREAGVRGARALCDWTWRGGLGGLTCYDEVFAPRATLRAMDEFGFDAACVVGADWCLACPALTDALVDRHAERPGSYTLMFTQAAPGLAPALVARSVAEDIAQTMDESGVFASLGALLGYVPVRPRTDPIVKPICVGVEPIVRDLHLRCIADRPALGSVVAGIMGELGEDALCAPAQRIAALLAARRGKCFAGPEQVTLELCTGRLTSGQRRLWVSAGEPIERPVLGLERAGDVLTSIASASPAVCLTLAGAGDPLSHAGWREAVALARAAGINTVHIRTDLLGDEGLGEAVLASGADIVSVDLLAADDETYRRLCGIDARQRAEGNFRHLLAARDRQTKAGGLWPTWVVPRMTRCDAVYGQVERFYDAWTMAAGCCVIDQLPRAMPGERIAPLAMPVGASRARCERGLLILSDLTAPWDLDDLRGVGPSEDVRTGDPVRAWRKIRRLGERGAHERQLEAA